MLKCCNVFQAHNLGQPITQCILVYSSTDVINFTSINEGYYAPSLFVAVQDTMSSIYLILPFTFGPGVYLASNRKEYQKKKMFLGSTAWPVHMAGNLTTI
jgi:hypothetical protein